MIYKGTELNDGWALYEFEDGALKLQGKRCTYEGHPGVILEIPAEMKEEHALREETFLFLADKPDSRFHNAIYDYPGIDEVKDNSQYLKRCWYTGLELVNFDEEPKKSVYRVIAPVPHFNSPTGVTNVDLAEFDDLDKAKEFRSALMIHSQIVEITK